MHEKGLDIAFVTIAACQAFAAPDFFHTRQV
jgi:hypothetical protein